MKYEVLGTLKEEDYLFFTKNHNKSRVNRFILITIVILALDLSFYLLTHDQMFLMLLVFIVILTIFYSYHLLFGIKKEVKKIYKTIYLEEMKYIFNQKGSGDEFSIVSSSGNLKIKYSDVYDIKQKGIYLFVYINKVQAYILRKDMLEDGNWDDFCQFVKNNVGIK